MRMLSSAILVAAAGAATATAAAQNVAVVQKPPSGLSPTPAAGRVPVLPLKPNARRLTVRYPDQPGIEVVLATTPAAAFACTADASGGYPYRTCTAQIAGGKTELRAGWKKTAATPVLLPPTPIAGSQWEGDCKGTAGEACVLDMSAPRMASIDFNGELVGGGLVGGGTAAAGPKPD